MSNPILLHSVPSCGLPIIPDYPDDEQDTFEDNVLKVETSVSLENFDFQTSQLKYKSDWGKSLDKLGDRDTIKYKVTRDELKARLGLCGVNKNVWNEDATDEDEFKGTMSPLCSVTLPPKIKELVGIREEARYFAFLHPPQGLADVFNWQNVLIDRIVKDGIKESENVSDSVRPPTGLRATISRAGRSQSNKDDDAERTWAIPFCAILGGFAYFDENKDLVQVNVLSPFKTKYKFPLAGPFKANKDAMTDLREFDRVFPLTLSVFHECSFNGLAVTSPSELFRTHPICDGGHKGMHGAMCFYRDDGSALVYEFVGGDDFIDPEGNISSIQDAFEYFAKVVKGDDTMESSNEEELQDLEFVQLRSLPKADVDTIRRRKFQRVLESEFHDDGKKMIIKYETLVDTFKHEFTYKYEKGHKNYEKVKTLYPYYILHHACKAKCGIDVVKALVECLRNEYDENFAAIISDIEWTPLHYAARYNPEYKVINYLLEQSEKEKLRKDVFHRYPLHLALNASSSVDKRVIKRLCCNEAIKQPTLYLSRTPLHIACNRGASKDIFELLIQEADEAISDSANDILTKQTRLKCTPLQLAVEKRLSHEIIKLLIPSFSKDTSDYNSHPLYTEYNGMVPLAHACWNRSKADTINVLLKCDEKQRTIHERVQSGNAHETMKSIMKEVNGMTPLHLAATHDDSKVVALLLKADTKKRYESTLFFRDHKQRIPLHIACENDATDEIVEQLLFADARKESTHAIDDYGRTPLHYICDNKNATRNVVERLLAAEDEYVSNTENEAVEDMENFGASLYDYQDETSNEASIQKNVSYKDVFISKNNRSSRTLDKQKRSPLFYAVKSNSENRIISPLLAPKYIYLKGFESLVDELGDIIQNRAETGDTYKKLKARDIALETSQAQDEENLVTQSSMIQNYLLEELSSRRCFCLMMFDIITHTGALVAFLYCLEIFLKTQNVDTPFLWLFIGVGVAREILRVLSKGLVQYALDFWSLSELVSVLLVTLSNVLFLNANESEGILFLDEKPIFIACGVVLVINLAFVLRTTFVPFARFIGGLFEIFYVLIPFLTVAALVLLVFAFSYRMIGGYPNCETLGTCYFTVLQAFFAGAEQTKGLLDIGFGIIVIVVLLNVVIAIVEQGWNQATERTFSRFWRYRLSFLVENRSTQFSRYFEKCFSNITNTIDNIEDIKFADEVPWTKAPYSSVDSQEKYMHPYDYFSDDVAEQIKNARSFMGSWYWIQVEKEKRDNDEVQDENTSKSQTQITLMTVNVVSKFLMLCLTHLLLLIVGIPTCGFFWPKSVRKSILSVGLKEMTEKLAESKEEADELPPPKVIED